VLVIASSSVQLGKIHAAMQSAAAQMPADEVRQLHTHTHMPHM
jgi:hypothetical protein